MIRISDASADRDFYCYAIREALRDANLAQFPELYKNLYLYNRTLNALQDGVEDLLYAAKSWPWDDV